MARYRDALPQLGGGLFLTDGGIETTLIFHEGLELPDFAAFDLLNRPAGQEALLKYFRAYAALAQELGVAPGTLAIAWCLRNPHVSTVMLGASKLSQLLQNFEALEVSQRFDDATWARVAQSVA